MELILIATVGIIVGGAVNALADTLPAGRLPSLRRSDGDSPLPVYTRLGVTALVHDLWRSKPPYPRRHMRRALTELALACIMALTHLSIPDDGSVPSGQALIWHAFAALFVLIAAVDFERKRILIVPVAVAGALALLDSAVFPHPPPNLASAIVGGLCGGVTFAIVYLGGLLFGRLANGIDSAVFGQGDVYVMALAGLIVGFPHILVAMVMSITLGGAGAALHLARRPYRRYTALAYGPYILAATYSVLLFHSEIGLFFFGLPAV